MTGANDLLPDEYSAFYIGFSFLAASAYVFRWFYGKSIGPRVTGSTVESTVALHYTSLTITRRFNAVLT